MAANNTILDAKLLKSFQPLNKLSLDKLNELASKSSIEELPAGRPLFRQGENDKRTLYLLAGQIELTETGNVKSEIIKAKSQETKRPIAQQLPRPCSGRTKTEATILSIDTDLLEILLDDNLSGTYEVDELGSDDSTYWMLRFLQSRAFLRLPTDNIQALLMAMEEMPAHKDAIIIKQGEKDDYYYIVQKGKCSVSRRPAPNVAEMQLAILSEGDGFGEEALITNGKRNATITMLEDGMLMRLNKHDFMTYLAKPLIQYTEEKDVLESISKGSLLIDVRTHEEFQARHVEGSVNIPLSMLRLKLAGLNHSRDYILCCNDSSRSAAAAFLLTQHGLTCHVLKGGLEKANIKLPSANLAVSVMPKIENRKTQAAERNKKVAEQKAEKIEQQAENTRKEAAALSQRVAKVEEARRKAEHEVERLQKEELAQRDSAIRSAKMRIEKEAERAKIAEEKAAKLKLEAKAASKRAEEELQKIKTEASAVAKRQKALDESLKRAKEIATETAKAAADARRQAEKEADEIRRQAQEEAKRLREEMEATTRKIKEQVEKDRLKDETERKAAMDEVRRKAEEAEEIRRQAKHEAENLRTQMQAEREKLKEQAERARAKEEEERNAAMEEARRKAEEAEEIRRQAKEEAERLQAELAATRKQFEETVNIAKAEEEKQRQQMLEQAQQHAQDVIQQTTLKAEQEAEEIRRRAQEEAEQLSAELESTRRQIEESRENTKQEERKEYETMLEAARQHAQQVLQESSQKAEQEAEETRRQALEEADLLRTELASVRQQIQETVNFAKTTGDQQRHTIISEAQQHAQEVIQEATLKAEQKAELVRQQAQAEAEQLRAELEQTRQQLAREAAKARAEEAQERQRQQEQDKRRKQQEHKAAQQRAAASKKQKQEQARKLAEEIKTRLEHAEKQRQEEEVQNVGNGMSLAEVSVKRVKDRIILEGAEDIFIFKEPSAVVEEETVEPPTLYSTEERDENELPSFTVDSHDEPVVTPFNSKEFSKSIRERDEAETQGKRNKRRNIVTVAASLIFTAVLGAGFVFYKPLIEKNLFAENQAAPEIKAKASINPVDNLKKAVSGPSKLARANQESKLKTEAETTFNRLLDEWKAMLAQKTTTEAAQENPAAEVTPQSDQDASDAATNPANAQPAAESGNTL